MKMGLKASWNFSAMVRPIRRGNLLLSPSMKFSKVYSGFKFGFKSSGTCVKISLMKSGAVRRLAPSALPKVGPLMMISVEGLALSVLTM